MTICFRTHAPTREVGERSEDSELSLPPPVLPMLFPFSISRLVFSPNLYVFFGSMFITNFSFSFLQACMMIFFFVCSFRSMLYHVSACVRIPTSHHSFLRQSYQFGDGYNGHMAWKSPAPKEVLNRFLNLSISIYQFKFLE